MSANDQSRKYLSGNLSLWILLLTNLVAIFFAITENWDLLTLMWIYGLQGIAIGFFNFIRILQLEKFSTKGLLINGRFVDPTFRTKMRVAFFFLLHYGTFHLAYFVILKIKLPQTLENLDLKFVYITALLFFANHLFSYIYNKPQDVQKQNIKTLMFYPYARIIPMYLTFAFIPVSSFVGMLPFFLILKTLADAIMHTVEHKIIRKNEQQIKI